MYVRKTTTTGTPNHEKSKQNTEEDTIMGTKGKNNMQTTQSSGQKKYNTGKEDQETTSKWVKCVIMYSYKALDEKLYQDIIKETTPYKMLWLGQQIDARRINWKEGSEQILFHPNHVVWDSMTLLHMDLYK